MNDLGTIATLLRAAQLYAHGAHHLAAGPTFVADHKLLGKFYAAYEEAYDAVVERMIFLGLQPNLAGLGAVAAAQAKPMPADVEAAWARLAQFEEQLRTACDEASAATTLGTANLLAGLADDSERRAYLIERRLA